MNYDAIISILAFIIFILFLLFSAFLLTVKTGKKTSNALLALFLIVVAMDISVFFYHQYITLPLHLEMLRIRLSDLKDPLLFLYVLSVVYADFKLRSKHLVHILPWLISIIVLMPNFFLAENAMKLDFFQNYDSTPEISFLNTLGGLLTVSYFAAQVYYVLRYRKILLENYTTKNYFHNYNWLKQLLFILLFLQVITIAKGAIRVSYDQEVTDIARIILLLFGFLFSCWLVLKALNSPKLFRGIQSDQLSAKELLAKENPAIAYAPNKEIVSLKEYMIEEEPFLNPSLTIQNLSYNIDMSPKELSILINHTIGQHFFDFVNGYRIEKAKEILKNPSKKKHTILEILYEVGFNSKSSFNTAFKKHTGTTPTEYRKSNL